MPTHIPVPVLFLNQVSLFRLAMSLAISKSSRERLDKGKDKEGKEDEEALKEHLIEGFAIQQRHPINDTAPVGCTSVGRLPRLGAITSQPASSGSNRCRDPWRVRGRAVQKRKDSAEKGHHLAFFLHKEGSIKLSPGRCLAGCPGRLPSCRASRADSGSGSGGCRGLGGLGFQLHPAGDDAVAKRCGVASDEGDRQVFREVVVEDRPTSGRYLFLKLEGILPELLQQGVDVTADIVMAFACQLGDLAAGHCEGGGDGQSAT